MSEIHPTAIVDKNAKIGDNVSIGPYAIIEGNVTLENNVEVAAHALVRGNTVIGEGTRIFHYASIGGDPQDKKFTPGEEVFLEVGKNNIFREYTTINAGTLQGGGKTKIGDENLFMAYTHVAHDCIVGNECIFANAGTLGGHVIVEDRAVIGGLAAAHQFVRIGKMAIIGGCSKATQDIPPFTTVDGVPARLFGLNLIGLKRAGRSHDDVRPIKQAYKILFQSGLARQNAIEQTKQDVEQTDDVKHLLKFVEEAERGLCKV